MKSEERRNKQGHPTHTQSECKMIHTERHDASTRSGGGVVESHAHGGRVGSVRAPWCRCGFEGGKGWRRVGGWKGGRAGKQKQGAEGRGPGPFVRSFAFACFRFVCLCSFFRSFVRSLIRVCFASWLLLLLLLLLADGWGLCGCWAHTGRMDTAERPLRLPSIDMLSCTHTRATHTYIRILSV